MWNRCLRVVCLLQFSAGQWGGGRLRLDPSSARPGALRAVQCSHASGVQVLPLCSACMPPVCRCCQRLALGVHLNRVVSSCCNFWLASAKASIQLSATDVSARTTMKGAAKCDKHCELQNSVNQQGFERILRFRDIPESMPASASTSFHACDMPHLGGPVA